MKTSFLGVGLVAGGHALFGDGAPAPVVSKQAAEEHFWFQLFDDLGIELFVELIEDCAVKHGRGGVHVEIPSNISGMNGFVCHDY